MIRAAKNEAGESYVIFSPIIPPEIPTWRGYAKAGDAPRLAFGVTGDGSNDDLPDSRLLIDFVDGYGDGLSSSSLVTATREIIPMMGTENLPDVALPVRWSLATERNSWTSGTVTLKYLNSEIRGLDETTLKLYQASAANGPWTEVFDVAIDQNRNQISGNVSSLGYFAITGELATYEDEWLVY